MEQQVWCVQLDESYANAFRFPLTLEGSVWAFMYILNLPHTMLVIVYRDGGAMIGRIHILRRHIGTKVWAAGWGCAYAIMINACQPHPTCHFIIHSLVFYTQLMYRGFLHALFDCLIASFLVFQCNHYWTNSGFFLPGGPLTRKTSRRDRRHLWCHETVPICDAILHVIIYGGLANAVRAVHGCCC